MKKKLMGLLLIGLLMGGVHFSWAAGYKALGKKPILTPELEGISRVKLLGIAYEGAKQGRLPRTSFFIKIGPIVQQPTFWSWQQGDITVFDAQGSDIGVGNIGFPMSGRGAAWLVLMLDPTAEEASHGIEEEWYDCDIFPLDKDTLGGPCKGQAYVFSGNEVIVYRSFRLYMTIEKQ